MRIDKLYKNVFGKPFNYFLGFTEEQANILKSEILKLSEPEQCDVLYSIVSYIKPNRIGETLTKQEFERNQILRNFIRLPEWEIYRKEHFLYEPL